MSVLLRLRNSVLDGQGRQGKSRQFLFPLIVHEKSILFPNLLPTMYFMKNFLTFINMEAEKGSHFHLYFLNY